MIDFDISSYVATAASAIELTLTAEETARVSEAFALVVLFSRPCLDFRVDVSDEPALVFVP